MKKWSRSMCRNAQHSIQSAAWTFEAGVQQTSCHGPTASLIRRSFSASAPCLTLTSMTVCNRSSASAEEPDFQRRCFATQARSRTYYYDILGVSPKATQKEIKGAYYKMSKVYHPDINKKEESKMFTDITEAYEILGNTKKRRMYDHGIFSRNEPPVDDQDYTQSFRQREGFGFERRAPPTGRTSTYNFDEFYRQHYGNTVRQEKSEREYLKQMEHQTKTAQMERKLRLLVTGSVVVSLIAMFFINTGAVPGKKPKP